MIIFEILEDILWVIAARAINRIVDAVMLRLIKLWVDHPHTMPELRG